MGRWSRFLWFSLLWLVLTGSASGWVWDGCTGDTATNYAFSILAQTKETTVTATESGGKFILKMEDTGGFACSGEPTASLSPRSVIESVTWISTLTSTSNGFTSRQLRINGTTYTNAVGVKVWPRTNATGLQWTRPIDIVLTGTPSSIIPLGTELVRIRLRNYENIYSHPSGYAYDYRDLTLRLGESEIWAKTCNVTDYDTQVVLPAVQKNKLTSVTGRYNAISKPLNLTLKCDQAGTKVSVKFTGTAMSSTDNVLKNEWSGNDDVGFQLMFNGNPVKLNDTLQVITSSTNTSQQLTFDTHYYYRGSGTVTAGGIKSSAEFLFTYQ